MTNTNSTYDLVCIGSGPAGQRGAIQAAKLGKRVAIIERRAHIGGVCLGTGTIPSKTFREAVLTLTAAQADGHSGTQSKRPSAAQLLDRVGEVMQREAEVVETQLTRNDVEMIRGEASFVDPHTLRVVDGTASRNLHADNVLLCVGTNPTRPENISDPSGVILTSDDICHLQRVPRTLTVVGAGVIGLEYASMFGRLGVEVTVIDRRPRPLEFLDVEIVDELIHQMRNTSVVFRPNETVSSIEVATEPKARAVVNLESGKRVVSEMVLFAIGRTGATRKLGLENAGLEADERGRLTVDDGYRTSVPHIFAAGDVIGYPSLAATSSEQGRRAICTAFDHGARPMSPNFPIGIYSIPELSMVGAPEHELTAKKIPYEVGIARYREIARGQILGDDSGLFKMIFHRDTRALLGVHTIGTHATELIHIGQAVLELNGGLDYFLKTVFNYPTLAECYKVAAYDAYNKLAM